jgi:hypothetical protein
MDILIYNPNLELQGILEGFKSLVWTRRYNEYGDFKLNALFDDYTNELLVRGNIIKKSDDSEGGIIENIQYKRNNNGEREIIVSGRFLTSYLTRRVIKGINNYKNNPINIIQTMVDKNAITTESNRIIPKLSIKTSTANRTNTIECQVSYKNLYDKVSQIAMEHGLGFRILFDDSEVGQEHLLFEVYEGRNLSDTIIFSEEYENIISEEFMFDSKDFKNMAYIGGEGEGVERVYTSIGDNVLTGIDRYEMFVDADDIRSEVDGVILPSDQYLQLLLQRGNEKLSELTCVENFDSMVDTDGSLQYKIDYDLGDIVTYVSGFDIISQQTITEIEEVYEGSNTIISAVFGKKVPSLSKKLINRLGR